MSKCVECGKKIEDDMCICRSCYRKYLKSLREKENKKNDD